MPFWWKRRRRPWWGRRYKRRWPKTRRRRKRYTYRRRKYRRPARRSRRRRKKVRRKKPALLVKQWQPDSIVLCKIIGFQSLCWGAEGSQFQCATHTMYDYTRTKYPGGGGFAAQLFTLEYLYDQWKLKNNIWTKTNEYKDLCRYLKCNFTFFRHPHVDFVVVYERQPPFYIEKQTYMQYHPYSLLLRKHKIIIPSLTTNPKGKYRKKKTIKPPKQMLTKWFFQQQFSKYDLVLLIASACSLRYPTIGCCNENRMITLTCIHSKFFQKTDWGATKSLTTTPHFYQPYEKMAQGMIFKGPLIKDPNGYNIFTYITTIQDNDTDTSQYYRSIDMTGGWFSPKVLTATEVIVGTQSYKPLPLIKGRYNPAVDDGRGNKVFLQDIMGGTWGPPTKTDDWLIQNEPLWKIFWGYWDYLRYKYHDNLFPLHVFVIESPYIHPETTEIPVKYWCFIDPEFLQGKDPWGSTLTYSEKRLWYPTCYWQQKTINSICECGPFVPKLNNQTYSTWELMTKYTFHFKWGGPQVSDQLVEDPGNKNKYDVPDTIKEAIQILNPTKNIAATMFHDWDYRRGCITSTAIKRMQQNLQTDSSISSDSETEPPKKKKRIQPLLHDPEKKTEKINRCLLSLCEESTCQEIQKDTDIIQLIQQQQQQQQHLKHNLLLLIRDLKRKQKQLQLQTGVME
nr:MAG: ORF1 [Torque teno midi virus]